MSDAAGRHHEPGHVEHRIPVAPGERAAHRSTVGAVGDQPFHLGR